MILLAFVKFNTCMIVLRLRVNMAIFTAFGCLLEVTLLLLSVGNFAGNAAGVGIVAVDGWVGIITALVAWYASAAGQQRTPRSGPFTRGRLEHGCRRRTGSAWLPACLGVRTLDLSCPELLSMLGINREPRRVLRLPGLSGTDCRVSTCTRNSATLNNVGYCTTRHSGDSDRTGVRARRPVPAMDEMRWTRSVDVLLDNVISSDGIGLTAYP